MLPSDSLPRPLADDIAAPLWEASSERRNRARITAYMRWLQDAHGVTVTSYRELWEWSVSRIEDFWQSIWEYFDIQASAPYQKVLERREMPGAVWFRGARLNYAEHIFRMASPDRPAMVFCSEGQAERVVSWDELRATTGSLIASFRQMGVQPGDRVAGYLPTSPETLMAFLACASLGAVWASASPDAGVPSVVSRFRQIDPTMIIVADGYHHNGMIVDRTPAVTALQEALPSLRSTVLVPHADLNSPQWAARGTLWRDLTASEADLTFTAVDFDHPLWILFSSGTSGPPKPIVHGHGGILLELLKAIALEMDLGEGDRFFWHTTPGWSMWNFHISSLLAGCTVVAYEGSPTHPNHDALWAVVAATHTTCFGTSAGHLTASMGAAVEPGRNHDLSNLTCVASTGSALSPQVFRWVYEHVKPDLWLLNGGGGTETCSAFVGGSILLPVTAGEIQCRALGASVEAFDQDGHAVTDAVGELVITKPMPSMPLYFWQDPDGSRYRDAFFAMYPGVWRHGDWIRITPRDTIVLYGRSDAMLNRGGVSLSTDEVYRAVESIRGVRDSLVVGVERPDATYWMPLFVVLEPGVTLTNQLEKEIRQALRVSVSPRCIPDIIVPIPEVPRTTSGKKMEVPVKRIVSGATLDSAMSADSVINPWALEYFIRFASPGNPSRAATTRSADV